VVVPTGPSRRPGFLGGEELTPKLDDLGREVVGHTGQRTPNHPPGRSPHDEELKGIAVAKPDA
jgi:hypothetical protein